MQNPSLFSFWSSSRVASPWMHMGQFVFLLCGYLLVGFGWDTKKIFCPFRRLRIIKKRRTHQEGPFLVGSKGPVFPMLEAPNPRRTRRTHLETSTRQVPTWRSVDGSAAGRAYARRGAPPAALSRRGPRSRSGPSAGGRLRPAVFGRGGGGGGWRHSQNGSPPSFFFGGKLVCGGFTVLPFWAEPKPRNEPTWSKDAQSGSCRKTNEVAENQRAPCLASRG